jgi:hypothetical protein
MNVDIALEALKITFLPYIKSMQDFHFYYDNPMLWVFFMAVYLFLKAWRGWSHPKAFFYCASIIFVLLGATWIEKPLADIFTVPGYASSAFDPFILKMAILILTAVITVYFVFIDNS